VWDKRSLQSTYKRNGQKMDLHVERQCIDAMKAGETRQFLLLFDANFEAVYKYVARRVAEKAEVERIVRMTFLDALGQVENTPTDIGYSVWLYTLARPRAWEYIAKESRPGKSGLISVDDKKQGEKVDKMLQKLSMEEREIMRLKFFEEVTDGDVMTILDIKEGEVGTKIYRVLKRAHLLLFGESDDSQGVYFGELSGLFEKLRIREVFENLEVLKLSVKADVRSRIDRRDFAIEGKIVEEAKEDPISSPFKEPVGPPVMPKESVGSNDPAKIFVDAARGMGKEEIEQTVKEYREKKRTEQKHDLVDSWKRIFIGLPVVVFLLVLLFVGWNLLDHFDRVYRGYPTICESGVDFGEGFFDNEKRSLNKEVSNALCENFEVNEILYEKEEKIEVAVDVSNWKLEYTFEKRNNIWAIQRYARTPYSNEESG